MANYPNIYAGQLARGTTTSAQTITFGFDARAVRLANVGGERQYVRLGSSGDASTADAGLEASAIMELPQIAPIAGLSLFSTSTTTGLVDVLAYA